MKQTLSMSNLAIILIPKDRFFELLQFYAARGSQQRENLYLVTETMSPASDCAGDSDFGCASQNRKWACCSLFFWLCCVCIPLKVCQIAVTT